MPTDPFIPLYSSLAGGACAIVGSLLATSWAKWIERGHEARQFAKAFKGELSGIVNILELRNYQAGLRHYAHLCETEQKVHVYCVVAREEYRTIYKSNADKLGCLPGSLPEQISILYTQIAAILEEFHASEEIKEGKRNISVLGSFDHAAQRYRATAKFIDDLVVKAKNVISEIDRRYPA